MILNEFVTLLDFYRNTGAIILRLCFYVLNSPTVTVNIQKPSHANKPGVFLWPEGNDKNGIVGFRINSVFDKEKVFAGAAFTYRVYIIFTRYPYVFIVK